MTLETIPDYYSIDKYRFTVLNPHDGGSTVEYHFTWDYKGKLHREAITFSNPVRSFMLDDWALQHLTGILSNYKIPRKYFKQYFNQIENEYLNGNH